MSPAQGRRHPYGEGYWRDKHGVVHIVGLHSDTRVRTECGDVMLVAPRRAQNYETTDEPPTCIACVGEVYPWI